MATKKKPGRNEPSETRAEETQRKWQKIRDDAGEAAGTCSVFRLVQGKRDEQLGNVSVDDLGDDPYDLLRERWGGGEYLVTMRDQSGVFMAGSRVHYHLSGSPKKVSDAGTAELERLEKRLEKIGEGGGADSAVMLELVRQNTTRPPPTDFAPLVTAIGTVLAPVLTALLKRPELPEPLPPPPTALEQIETLGAVLSLAQSMNPPTDGIAGLAKTMGEPIAKLVDAHLSGAGAAAPPPPPHSAPEVSGVARPAWYSFLAPIMPQAMRWAAGGKDPELRGDFIVDELTDEQLGPVFQVLGNPAFRDEFFREFPEAQNHVDWFDVLFRRIASGIVPPDELDAMERAEHDAGAPELEVVAGGGEVADVIATDDVATAETRSLG